MKRERWLLAVLALPTLFALLRLPVPRLDADTVEYYSQLRSLYFDGDVDLANEYEHFGILSRRDKQVPTVTGYRRTTFSVGPALLWMPFYAAGDLVARARGDVQDGYSPSHIRAVTLGSLFYGVAGLLLLQHVLRALFPGSVTLATLLLLLYASFLYWYMVHEAIMSHTGSFLLSALVLRLWWDQRDRLTSPRALALGLLIGLAATVRWQNGVLLLLPAAALLRGLSRRPVETLRDGLMTLLAFAVGVVPQLLAWKSIFGTYLLADPPQGRDFLRLDHPYLLETLFSSRHGLLYWTPVFWAASVGYGRLLRRQRFVGIATLLPLLVMSYVNACSGDWWAGGSFSNRRFDSVLPFLALGLAAFLSFLLDAARRRPAGVLVAALMALGLWNFLFMEQYRRNMIPRDEVVSFAAVTENNAALLADSVGTPLAWPANWIWSLRHRAPVAKYDRAAGKYLFYRQNNLGGVIDIGDEAQDLPLLLDGWARPLPCEGAVCRRLEGPARLLAPLDVPETLDVMVRACGQGTLAVSVNGSPVAEFPLTERLAALRVRVPAALLRREANEIALVPENTEVRVERLVFTRLPKGGA